MVVLREKGRMKLSRNLLLGAAVYDTIRTRTTPHPEEIKTDKRDIKRWMVVSITKNPGEDDVCRNNLD